MVAQSQPNFETSHSRFEEPVLRDKHSAFVKDLYTLSGNKILGWILDHKNPQELVHGLPYEDFFWLFKKIGEDDCLPLLKLASVDQWEYLLDLEIWKKDRLNVAHTSLWMKRLQQADCKRLARWLLSEGKALAYYYFFKSIQVEKKNEDEDYDLPEGFFRLDGGFQIKAIYPEHQETIENILRMMASEDFDRCQTLLLGIGNFLPAEVEEEMYRLRNVRLAEHGFLPFEEALSIYAPLDPEALAIEKKPELPNILLDDESRAMVPVLPFYHAEVKNMLTDAASRIMDPLFLDRIRLEFAGLCNHILSADGILVDDIEILSKTCRKAAGYLNLALERLCGNSISSARDLLRSHPLVSIFRVGFGLALKLKWETERWLKGSWFYRQGLDVGFWGDQWGETIAGILKKKPLLYIGLKEGEEYKDFESLSEIDECRSLFHRLMVLDKLLERLTECYPIENRFIHSKELTFHPLLFNFWSRCFLKLKPCFTGISLGQAKNLFHQLRARSEKPPFQMPGGEDNFLKNFLAYCSDFEPEAVAMLKDTLSLVWQKFQKEYEGVSISDINGRYSKFFTITTSL
ncbi:MAG: hypothetical protein J7K02_05640 [Deltaproteobacteria bacterium]|nr:hypothetical protein [Deltaproteobacteria bacterium]